MSPQKRGQIYFLQVVTPGGHATEHRDLVVPREVSDDLFRTVPINVSK